ncbi:hypothetical protein DEAC_c00990 [Desulfosporosinus acididurans]|uniref:Transcription factor zinc-finger domain-containing protein n=1 Tax=Desulfosporosinus acididurans TaxID=476652 RepID=A0A0J1FW89_9FIRM|nr:hypothetical protein DEAC_c00990 [Desulfosporosinus acididurans]
MVLRCPKCNSNKYYYTYINEQEIVLCRSCGYWESMSLDDWEKLSNS